MTDKKYPVINYNYHLHLTAQDCSLFKVLKGKDLGKNMLGLKEFNQWKVHPIMAKYLSFCDGQKSHKEIVKLLKVPFSIMVDEGVRYLEDNTGVLSMREKPEECSERLFLTGDFDSYKPLHMSIEITDYCNFRCKHCYVSASPDKKSKRSYKDLVSLMDKLWNNGVKVIELTGGECTTHPEFKEILKYASERFNLVAVISNGYIIGQDESLAEYIGEFDNVAVQISLDGMEEYHDTFRNMENAFKNAVQAIKYLRKYNCITRVACTVTYENLDDVEEVFKLCQKLDVDSFATATVSSFGRGTCYGCNKGEAYLKGELIKKLAKYHEDKLFLANKLTMEAVEHNKDVNCGAGWRTFALNGATGNVRVCLFLSDEGVVGNIDKDSYTEIFKKKKLDVFRFAPAPTPLLETCKECEFSEKCNGCMARAIETYQNDKKDCKWIKKYNIKFRR